MKQLTIIIPAFNEEGQLPRTLEAIGWDERIELLVVDGGSQDSTTEISLDYGCRVIASPAGKSRQLRAGAEAATGANLLFLHADTLLPEGYFDTIITTLADDEVAAGAFSLMLDISGWQYRMVSGGANLRSRYLNLPYGDQGLFLRRSTYFRAGGFPDMAIMEDYVFIKTLGKLGRIITLPEKVTTSGRRWQNLGLVHTTCINQLIVICYLLGVKDTTLARWYRRLEGVGG